VNLNQITQDISDMSLALATEKAKANPNPSFVTYYQSQIDQDVAKIAADGPTAKSQAVTLLSQKRGDAGAFSTIMNGAITSLSTPGATAQKAADRDTVVKEIRQNEKALAELPRARDMTKAQREQEKTLR